MPLDFVIEFVEFHFFDRQLLTRLIQDHQCKLFMYKTFAVVIYWLRKNLPLKCYTDELICCFWFELWVAYEKGTYRIRITQADERMIVEELMLIDSPHSSPLHWLSTVVFNIIFFLSFSIIVKASDVGNVFDVIDRIHLEELIFFLDVVPGMHCEAFCAIFGPLINVPEICHIGDLVPKKVDAFGRTV